MDGPLLSWAGMALFGPHWKSELRAALAVNEREFRRWIAGTTGIPDGVADQVFLMLESRREAIDRLLASKPGAPTG